MLGRSQLSPWVQNGQIEWRAGSDKKSCSLQIELAKSIMDIFPKIMLGMDIYHPLAYLN